MSGGPRILIVGGGYGGLHTALRLERLLRPGEATVTVVNPQSYMTYQPLLAGATAGKVEQRHVVVPLRAVQRRTQVIKAAVSSIDHARRVVRGFPAWLTHRTYHLLMLPTMNRRLRLVADWTLALLFPREVVSLDVLEHPRRDFEAALQVTAAGPPCLTSFPVREEKEDDHHAYRR